MGKCKFGKWIYSKTYKVSAFHCCYGTEQGCYFEAFEYFDDEG